MSCKALYSDFGNADNDRLWIISLPTNWKVSKVSYSWESDTPPSLPVHYDHQSISFTKDYYSHLRWGSEGEEGEVHLFTPSLARRTCSIWGGEPIFNEKQAWLRGQEAQKAWDNAAPCEVFPDGANVSFDENLRVDFLSLPSNYTTHRSFALCTWAIAAVRQWQDTPAPITALLDYATNNALICTRHFNGNSPKPGSDEYLDLYDDNDNLRDEARCFHMPRYSENWGWCNIAYDVVPSEAKCTKAMAELNVGSFCVTDPTVAGMIYTVAEGETIAILERALLIALPIGDASASDIVVTDEHIKKVMAIVKPDLSICGDLWREKGNTSVDKIVSRDYGRPSLTRMSRALCRRAGILQITGEAMSSVLDVFFGIIDKIFFDLHLQAKGEKENNDEGEEEEWGGEDDDDDEEEEEKEEDDEEEVDEADLYYPDSESTDGDYKRNGFDHGNQSEEMGSVFVRDELHRQIWVGKKVWADKYEEEEEEFIEVNVNRIPKFRPSKQRVRNHLKSRLYY